MFKIPRDGSTLDIDISKEGVPVEAYEVIIFAYVECGAGNKSVDGVFSFSTVTAQGKIEAKLYFTAYDQSAWSFNSENIALPVQKERVVHVRMTDTTTTPSFEHLNCKAQVVGYRKPPK